MHPCVAKTKDSYIGTFVLRPNHSLWPMADIELGSHLFIKAKHFWPEGDRFRQVPLY